MKTEYVIADNTITILNARNPLEERYLYGVNTWVKGIEKAQKFSDSQSAINIARKLNEELPVKVLLLQTQGNRIGIGEIKF